MGFSKISDVFPNMCTVLVRFDGNPHRQYSYLATKTMGLKQGDLVVVPTKETFALAKVVTSISGMTDMASRMIVCKVPLEAYKAMEQRMAHTLGTVQAMQVQLEIQRTANKGCDLSCLHEHNF